MAFTLLSGTHKWYANREMRFYATIAFNNSYFPPPQLLPTKWTSRMAKWPNISATQKWTGLCPEPSPRRSRRIPDDRIFCRKFLHYEDSWISGGRQKTKYCPAYRMAEVYLNYVEAMNELDQAYTINDITVTRNTSEMKRCFNLIRYRPDYRASPMPMLPM